MCGRYVIAFDPETLVEAFGLEHAAPFERRWNVAPTSTVPVVHETRDGRRVAEPMRWGLVPHWAKDTSIGAKLNNARAEGIAAKPSFRQAVRRRRCILPASGFYEWTAAVDADGRSYRQPHLIAPSGAPLFAMAGLFEAWRPAGDDTAVAVAGATAADVHDGWLLTCCVVTTAADGFMHRIHDRMPVMLGPDDVGPWLDRHRTDPDALAPLMRGLGPGARRSWPVSRAVSRAGNEGPQLVEPVGPVTEG